TTKKEEVLSKASDTIFGIQAQASLTESAKETETCMTFASDLRTSVGNVPTILPFRLQNRTLTEQRRSRLRELILKTTKNLENIANLNYDFCQQLEDISFSLTQ
ncbi:unnamed protein product, partial [Taenia asiatica]|uniref:Tektin n=1 Tax=Taenia asiatica TaxID=60517 RepID=A0A0R3W6J4_TAEAS